MSALRGAILGALGLTLLEAVTSRPQNARNTGTFFTKGAAVVNRLVDPTVPLIPDLRGK